jgi:ATP-dependent helicase/nuclease subunit A
VDVATARGTAIHALLEHLPALPSAERAAAARRIAPDAAPDAVAEALAVLDDLGLAPLFAAGTLAEVPFALPASSGRPAIAGTMDRVLVAPDRVTVVDYKTNARVPDRPEEVPAGLLAQMGAYRAAAAAIWPERKISVAILWTRTRVLMDLPPEAVSAAWAGIDPPAPGA